MMLTHEEETTSDISLLIILKMLVTILETKSKKEGIKYIEGLIQTIENA